MGRGHRNNVFVCERKKRELEDEALAKRRSLLCLFITQSAAISAPDIITSQQSVFNYNCTLGHGENSNTHKSAMIASTEKYLQNEFGLNPQTRLEL